MLRDNQIGKGRVLINGKYFRQCLSLDIINIDMKENCNWSFPKRGAISKLPFLKRIQMTGWEEENILKKYHQPWPAARKMSLGKFSHFQTTFLTLKSFSFKILPFQEQSEIIYKVSSTSRTAVPFPVARKCRIQLSKMLKQIFKIKNPFLCRRYFPQANISCMECKLFSDNLSRAAGLGNNKDKSIEKMLLDFFILEPKSCSVKGKWEMIEIRVVWKWEIMHNLVS